MNVQLKDTDFLKFGDAIIAGDLQKVSYRAAKFYQINELSIIHMDNVYVIAMACGGTPSGCITVSEKDLTTEDLQGAMNWFKEHNVEILEYKK